MSHYPLDEHPLLDDTLRLLKSEVIQFCRNKIAPLRDQVDRQGAIPTDLWTEMGNMGLLGVTAPAEFGGLELGYLAHVMVMEQISRASPSIGLSYGAHSNLCINQLALHGNPEQQQTYLPPLISGEKVGALAMSEPNAGSDVISMKLKAEVTPQGFELNGSKMWITNGPEAEVILVYGKTAPDQGSHGISCFIVDGDNPGLVKAQKLDKLGMRGSQTCELNFNHCRLNQGALLGGLNQGVSVLMKGLDYERLVLAAGPLGIMLACLDTALPYIRERKQFGSPIGSFQLVQAKIADMYSRYLSSRALVYQVAASLDQGKVRKQDTACAILFSAEAATRCALDTIQLLGGNGYTNEYPAGLLLRDAKLYEIGAGTTEIRKLLIGRTLFEETQ